MKAVKLTGIRRMEIMKVPVPEILSASEVLIHMQVVGVCGSDVHYFETGKIGSLVVDYPFAVGHEGAGVVEAVGPEVTLVKPGDRIVIEPSVACGSCQQCLSGRPHTCLNNKFLGCPGQSEGNLMEYIVMDQKQCLKLEDHQSFDDGALSEPLSIGLYANKQANYLPDDDVAIIGYGPIGMSVMLTAEVSGVKSFMVSDKVPERLLMAKSVGAIYTGNPLRDDVVEEILAQKPNGMDVVFECCGDQDVMDQAIELVKPGGKIMIIGIPAFDRWSFSADLARRKEVSLIHVRRQNNCVEEVLSMMAKGQLEGSRMVTHRFTLDQTQQAFELVNAYRDGVMKAMIDF